MLLIDLDQPAASGPPDLWSRAAPLSRLAPTEELLRIASERAFDSTIFDETPPVFSRAQISNSRVDFYATRMCGLTHDGGSDGCTLGNYARDAAEGRSVLLAHNSRSAPLGASLTGVFTAAGTPRVHSDFFLLPGIALTGSDDVIRLVRSGAQRDVSIGFTGGTFACGLCGRSYWSWECGHIAGLKYAKNDKGEWVLDRDGTAEKTTTAFAWIHEARLSEFSLVFDGATPDAQVTALKAMQETEGGRMTAPVASLLEQRFRIKLPGTEHRWAGTDLHPKEEHMAGNRTQEAAAGGTEPTAAERVAFEQQVAQLTTERDQVRAELAEQRGRWEPLERAIAEATPAEGEAHDAFVRRLASEAADGRAYRADLIEETLREGVRANGPEFKAEDYRELLASASIERIKAVRDGLAATAQKLFPGGRQSAEIASRGNGTGGDQIPVSARRAR